MTNALLLFAQAQEVPSQDAPIWAGVFFFLCIAFSMLLGFASLAFWIWMLVDCIQNEQKSPDNQFIIWLLVILLGQGLGAIIYFFVRRLPRKRSQAIATPPHGQPPGKM
jgi:hypothetical protein